MRPAVQSDIGLVGRSGTKYTLFVGGSHRGDRLSFVLQDLVDRDQVVPLVRKLVDRFKVERRGDEGFGDWCTRQGVESLCGTLGCRCRRPSDSGSKSAAGTLATAAPSRARGTASPGWNVWNAP